MIVLSVLLVAIVMCMMVRVAFVNRYLRLTAYAAVAVVTIPMFNIDYTQTPTLFDMANSIIWALSFNAILFALVGRIVCGVSK